MINDSNTNGSATPNHQGPVLSLSKDDLGQAGARDILIFRGAEYWPTPEDVIREVHAQGLSVRIPRNNIPEGLVRGLSRIALAHIKAVMTIDNGTEEDLRTAFEALTQVEGHDPKVDKVLERNYDHRPSRWLEMPECDAKREIFDRLGVSFKPGIFAYCYYTGATYYLKPDETEAPEELAAKGIQAVRGIVAETGEAIDTWPEKELDLEGATE